jgi:L-ascorbate metabolism protein UlaG (beta-lactamase superfamily)
LIIENLDLHFYSHNHWDHFSSNVTEQIFELTSAPVIAERQVASELENKITDKKLKSTISGKTITINGFEIKAISGIHPCPITLFRVKWEEGSFFHGADSGYVPLKDYPADIAFIPTGSPSPSCSPEKALKMVLDVEPKVAIAMHGTKRQMEKFKTLTNKELPDITVIIPLVNKPTKFNLRM